MSMQLPMSLCHFHRFMLTAMSAQSVSRRFDLQLAGLTNKRTSLTIAQLSFCSPTDPASVFPATTGLDRD